MRKLERIEIFEGVFLTFTDLSRNSRIRLLIEADERVHRVTMGFPYERHLRGVANN